jgi:poly(A) polymerase
MPIRDKIRPVVRDIVGQLVDNGCEAYIVGGAVRDLLIGIQPKDYDIATAATPEDVRRIFGRRRSRIIGRRFRLVHVYAGPEIYEVSTFRREPSPDERRERVSDDGVMVWRDNEYGTLEQDARRRDFTANALYYDPVGDRGIIDIVGGVRDLEERRARAIGDPGTRLDEDPVRMLRALKLVGQFGFHLDPGLDEALRPRVDRIALASQSRLFEELLKILATGRATAILGAFQEFGLLTHYWPALAAVWETPTGDQTRRLLAERDRRLDAGTGSPSKALALATASLPYVVSRLGGTDLGSLWAHDPAIEHRCRAAVHDFFRPFPVSRFFSARVRDIVLLLPRFASRARLSRLVRHPEYRYGRELYGLLGHLCGWPEEALADWPVPQGPHGPGPGGRHRPRRGGQGVPQPAGQGGA